jgi:hypothetical protein
MVLNHDKDGQGLWCHDDGRSVTMGHESQINFFTVYRKTPYLVPGTTFVFKIFLGMVLPGTDCSQKNYENFFSPKKGDLLNF